MKCLFWNKLPSNGNYPKSREGHCFLYLPWDDSFLVFGGIGISRYNEVFVFSSNCSSWSKLDLSGESPHPRNYHVAWTDVMNRTMFIFGGQGDKRDPLYDMHALNFAQKKWVHLYPTEQPSGRFHGSGAVLGSKFYLFGGASAPKDTLNNDLWSFDFSKINWKTDSKDLNCPSWTMHCTSNPPKKRQGHSVVGYKHQLYLFGGKTKQGFTNDLISLCTSSFKWNLVNAIGQPPPSRAFHSSCLMNSKMVIFGGTIHTAILNDFYMLDLNDLHWSRPFIGGFGPSERYGARMIYGKGLKSQLLILGGINQSYVGMDLFSLEYVDVNHKTEWKLEDQGSHCDAVERLEDALVNNRRKIRELELSVCSSREAILKLDGENQMLRDHSQKLDFNLNMQKDLLEDRIANLEREKVDIDQEIKNQQAKSQKLLEITGKSKQKIKNLEYTLKMIETLFREFDYSDIPDSQDIKEDFEKNFELFNKSDEHTKSLKTNEISDQANNN